MVVQGLSSIKEILVSRDQAETSPISLNFSTSGGGLKVGEDLKGDSRHVSCQSGPRSLGSR